MENKVSEIKHNIEHEQRLIELLGYNLIGPDRSNRWLITNEENQEVGFIQYKKLYNKNTKKNRPATFGYQTIIESSEVTYQLVREINNPTNYITINKKYFYKLGVKRENDTIDHLEINMEDNPSLKLYSKQYGDINFEVDDERMHLSFQSSTENFNIEESIIFRPNKEHGQEKIKEYIYQIRYCAKEKALSDEKSVTVREIRGTYNPKYHEPNHITISELTWVNGYIKTYIKNEVIGTIEEMVAKHQMGIDAFNYFRLLINQILPFKEDIIYELLNDELIEERELSIFIKELETKNKEKKLKKAKPTT